MAGNYNPRMSWERLEQIIRAEAKEDADRILQRIRYEWTGVRITIPTRRHPSRGEIDAALKAERYDVKKAAARLGVHVSTVYRKLNRPVR